ncbi:uncharacterized protein LOC108847470, partial [Raphanus sativus]|uniref:Uncharacterized protein LOC108847470 n=1 Tax=Raphanus sativus TaxID=3726 RepID=A0A9W3C3Q1_RAPSA
MCQLDRARCFSRVLFSCECPCLLCCFISRLSHLSPIASLISLPPRLLLSPPPISSSTHHHRVSPSSHHHRVSSSTHHHRVSPLSHHHHHSRPLSVIIGGGDKVHGGWSRKGSWRLKDASLVAAGGSKVHGCWKRVKLDGSSLDVAVMNSATLKDPKILIKEKVNEMEQANMGHRHISWKHVWSNFCVFRVITRSCLTTMLFFRMSESGTSLRFIHVFSISVNLA